MEFDIIPTRVRSIKIFDPFAKSEIGTFYTNSEQNPEYQDYHCAKIIEILKAGMAAMETQQLPFKRD